MREIDVLAAEDALASLLDLVAAGEEVVITRHGAPVARLMREECCADREKARRAAADILDMSEGIALGGLNLRELIDEGRR